LAIANSIEAYLLKILHDKLICLSW
jgi:hypothetical protein